MRCHEILSLILGFAFLSQALPQALQSRSNAVARRHVTVNHAVTATDAVLLKDFLISSIDTNSHPRNTHGQFNRTISFLFTDLNSNTSTTCSSNWTDTANSTNAPAGPSYLTCAPTKGTVKPEFFDWYFGQYTDPCHFTLQLTHEFSDPKDYPPPYDYVGYFASAEVSLTYEDAAGTKCGLPTKTGPIHAVITSISN